MFRFDDQIRVQIIGDLAQVTDDGVDVCIFFGGPRGRVVDLVGPGHDLGCKVHECDDGGRYGESRDRVHPSVSTPLVQNSPTIKCLISTRASSVERKRNKHGGALTRRSLFPAPLHAWSRDTWISPIVAPDGNNSILAM
jgi:hypothetical protein